MHRSAPFGPAGGLAVSLLVFAAACRCTGESVGPEAGVEADSTADEGCDAAWCTSACVASGAECGRCVEYVGCRCNADCVEPPNHCPPDAIEWDYPPIWERELGESWDFDAPTWDVSSFRFQPQPGCELISLAVNPDAMPGRYPARSSWVNDRYVALHDRVTRCIDGHPVEVKAVSLLDTTTWVLSVVYAADPTLEGDRGPMAVFDDGVVFPVTWYDPCEGDCGGWDPTRVHRSVLLYSARDKRQKVIDQYDGSAATLSLHAANGLEVAQGHPSR
jgi:hypothetical protein